MSKHQTAASTYSLIKTKRKADFELTKQVLNKVSGGGVYPLGSKSGDVTHGGYREIGFNCPASRNLIERDRRVVIADPLSILNPRRFTALKGPREAPVPGTDIQVVIR